MKATSSAKFICPGCKMSNMVSFKRPGFMEKSIFEIKCSACLSTVMYKIQRLSGDQAKVHCKVKKPSELLLAMQKEEKEFNEAPLE